MTTQKGLEFIKLISEYVSKTQGHDRLLNKIKFVSGGNGKCSAEFKVEPEHLNALGGLHGGYTATVVDAISTYALMTREDGVSGGVSVDIHVSYIKGAREGDDIVVDAKTIRAGRSLAFLEVELKKKNTNDIIAKGSHTKYIGQQS